MFAYIYCVSRVSSGLMTSVGLKEIKFPFTPGTCQVEKSKNDQLRQDDEVLIAKGEGTARLPSQDPRRVSKQL